MKLNPIAYAIIAAGLVGPTFAAYSGHSVAHKTSCGMTSGMSHVESIIAGNSYNSGVDSSVCWQDRVRFSGTLEAAYRNVKEGATTSKAFELNQAILGVDAKLNSAWSAKATFREGFAQAPVDYSDFSTNADLSSGWSVAEAFVAYSDSSRSPLFMKAGKGFVPFGHYSNPFEFSPTIVQAFSQLNEDYLQVGVASSAGWNASVAGWTSAVATNNPWRYSANLGFDHSVSGLGMHLNASYISSIDEVFANSSIFMTTAAPTDVRDSAWQASVSTDIKGFDVAAGYFHVNRTNSQSAWALHAGYAMENAGYSHKIGADYERVNTEFSSDIKGRWSADYTVGLAKNVDASLKYTKFSRRAAAFDAPRLWTVTLTGKF